MTSKRPPRPGKCGDHQEQIAAPASKGGPEAQGSLPHPLPPSRKRRRLAQPKPRVENGGESAESEMEFRQPMQDIREDGEMPPLKDENGQFLVCSLCDQTSMETSIACWFFLVC